MSQRLRVMLALRSDEERLLGYRVWFDPTEREDELIRRAREAVAAARLEVEHELGARAEKWTSGS